MTLIKHSCQMLAAGALFAVAAMVQPVQAQDISETHLDAAHQAIAAIRATEQFDAILPNAARALKAELIQKNPDLQEIIIETVDETAIALASRRADLEREAALAYARVLSEEQLNQIAEFYNSEAGKKLIEVGPIATREVIQAAEIWQRGIARDLAAQTAEKLAAAYEQPGTPAAAATTEGAAEPAAAPAEGAAEGAEQPAE